MKNYSPEFTAARSKVIDLKEALKAAEKELQDVCPHVHLNGASAIPRGTSFTDCSLCGQSTYYMGR